MEETEREIKPLDDAMLDTIVDYFVNQGERTKRFAGYLLDEIYRQRKSESIVAEREQLYIQVEEMKNKQAEMIREFWLIYSVTNKGSRANKRAHKAFQTFKPHENEIT